MLDHRVKQTRRKGKKKLMSTVDIIMFSLFILFIVWWILMINTFTSITDHTSRNKSPKEVMKFMPGRLDEVALPQYPVDHRSLPTSLSVEAIDMCHRTLWHTLETTAYVLPNDETVIITGDIDDLWLRDSAAQIHPLLVPNIHDGKSLVQTDAKLERIVSGLLNGLPCTFGLIPMRMRSILTIPKHSTSLRPSNWDGMDSSPHIIMNWTVHVIT